MRKNGACDNDDVIIGEEKRVVNRKLYEKGSLILMSLFVF